MFLPIFSYIKLQNSHRALGGIKTLYYHVIQGDNLVLNALSH